MTAPTPDGRNLLTGAGPYARAAWLYRRAGWVGVLPLPLAAKWPPPSGFTGWAGVDPSGADIQTWCDGPEAAGNIALRLPSGTYGLDVDAYGDKDGGASLQQLERKLGSLPATWTISSRDDGVSGIRLLRAELAPGRRWRDEPAGHGRGIEAIHFGHRYAVTWPSIHPDTGGTYLLRRPDGSLTDPGEVPEVDGLPHLSTAWIEGLSEPGEVSTGEAASHAQTLGAVSAFPAGDACEAMREAVARACARLREARDGAALHPAGRDATHELARLGHEGHAGARRALADHFSLFVGVREARGMARRDAESEWWRLVRGAAGKLAGPGRACCDCALRHGDGVTFDRGELTSPTTTWGELNVKAPTGDGGDDASGGEGGVGGSVDFEDEVRGGAREVRGEEGAGGWTGPLAARLLSAAQVRMLPPPEMVIDGLLTMNSESWMIAAAGSYKTFIALDMAAHVAAGKPWMGRGVKTGPVLYLLAEGVGGLGKRVRAWEQRNGPMVDDIHFLTTPVQAGQEEQWAALVDLVAQMRPVLIVLDTQARLTVGIKENDNTEMGIWVHAVGKLRRACGGCVLVVHHLGRNGQDARGASAIDGAQDSELKITRTADKMVVLTTDKQRHLPDDVRVELELFDCSLDDGGTSLVVGPRLSAASSAPDYVEQLPLNQVTLIAVMRDVFPALGATKAELKAEARKRARSAQDGARMEPMSESSFRRAWDALVDTGRFVRVESSQRHVLEEPVAGAGETP